MDRAIRFSKPGRQSSRRAIRPRSRPQHRARIWLAQRQPKPASEAACGRQISHNPIARNAAKPTRASPEIPMPDPAPAISCGAVYEPGTRYPRRQRARRGSMVREQALYRQRPMSLSRRSREAKPGKPERDGPLSSLSNAVNHARGRALLPPRVTSNASVLGGRRPSLLEGALDFVNPLEGNQSLIKAPGFN